MTMTNKLLCSTLCVIVLTACGGPGLPPAGPAPGEVDVGRGTQPEGKVTGAVTTVEDAKIGKSSPYRIEELLKGKLADDMLVWFSYPPLLPITSLTFSHSPSPSKSKPSATRPRAS